MRFAVRVSAVVLFSLAAALLCAETTSSSTTTTTTTATASTGTAAAASATAPVPYGPTEFPRWALDLRRGEAIAFGSLPFSLFLSQFAVDLYRCSQHSWSRSYAPWPFKDSGAVAMTEDEYRLTFAAACFGAVAFALVDFAIVTIKRHSARRAVESRIKADFNIERSSPAAPETPIDIAPPAPPQTESGTSSGGN